MRQTEKELRAIADSIIRAVASRGSERSCWLSARDVLLVGDLEAGISPWTSSTQELG